MDTIVSSDRLAAIAIYTYLRLNTVFDQRPGHTFSVPQLDERQ
jgi:hypothetical protein